MNSHITIGIDLGDRSHIAAVIDAEGNQLAIGNIVNTRSALKRFIQSYPGATVALEAGTHSPWISQLLMELGCRVYVGNPRKLRLIWDSQDKSDQRDAQMLARVCRLDPQLLWPVRHRDKKAHSDLAVIKSREMLVKSRTLLINHARGVVKTNGERLPGCSAASFAKRCQPHVPGDLWPALEPIFKMIADLSEHIRELDHKINQLCEHHYPETQSLQQVAGVGPVTALAYVLTLQDPARFSKSRQVGAYLGLAPGRDQSGNTDKQLRISKAGNKYLRQLLVSCAHYIIGPFGADSDLRRHGLAIAARGGKNAKKRAVVAVARKLAVLLHRLWVTGESYQLFYNTKVKMAA